jgi:acyl-coenzyme A thioesterase PaaI-like protein
MAVDQFNLVHGGFIFGLADYAAMLAVNHPNVVLGAAQVKFLRPTIVGDTAEATAQVETTEGKKQQVVVSVSTGEGTVFEGTFICFSLAKHVLAQ